MRIALIGDGQSPHLLKWARALAALPEVELWAASSRGFLPGFDGIVEPARRLALLRRSSSLGGGLALLTALPRLGRWLRRSDPDWLHAHYLTSHGTLAWLARGLWRLRARIVGSAWGSDILVTPGRSAAYRWLTRRVLGACALTTSDSQHMAARMRELGATEVMTFPFGLDAMPPLPPAKQAWLFFANRALEPLYRPERVLALFAGVAAARPEARLVVANAGSLADALQEQAARLGLRAGLPGGEAQVSFVGRLDSAEQAQWYAAARWYLSLPESDSVAVSVLEAMAHGCIPLLSDLPANRELVQDGCNGLIVAESQVDLALLDAMATRAERIAADNRAWVAQHALFAPHVRRFVARLRELSAP
ncbi:MAG: glycosyltransferase family 4 protein [Ideonella sp.]|nr:glycosyltransferase family 4 protein [Ideonella sp.]